MQVEFQNKFYYADGYAFQPFQLRAIEQKDWINRSAL